MKNIAILGSTGSIGKNCLEVIEGLADRFRVTYLSTYGNVELLRQQIEKHRPQSVVVLKPDAARQLRSWVGKQIEVLEGEEGLCSIVTRDDVDIVINALVGFAGLRPTIKAIEHKKKIALANKETLVAGGGVVAEALKDHHVELVPIDSEHSAILQCLAGEKLENVERLILTASGGPFLHFRKEELAHVTVEAALNHPNWKMGNKITIDSATMMNKGLEVIEAHWLFKLPPEKIHVVIHPQSIIHSMVEFIDGSVKAQLGVPDMKIPIQYALTYPDRMFLKSERLDFARLKQLTFLEPDREKFRCLELAYGALDLGGIAPAILNAANEVAVEAFLNRKTAFHTIAELIERALDGHNTNGHPDVEDIVEADRKTRLAVRSMIETKGKV